MHKSGYVLRRNDLVEILKYAGKGYDVGAYGQDDTAVLLEGELYLADLYSGIRIHATDAVEHLEGRVEVVLAPELTVSVLLQGTVEATLDDGPLCLEDTGGVTGKIWSAARPSRLVRHLRRGRHVRKVNVSVSPGWLRRYYGADREFGASLQRFAGRHLSMLDWTPDRSSVRCAEEILAGYNDPGIRNRLSLEIRALSILQDAFSVFDADIEQETQLGCRIAARDMARARSVRDYIDAHLADTLTLERIAHATCMSISTLQRVFKRSYGVSVANHLRARRLELARQSLLENALSIQQVASRVGYPSAANFSTAFKRHFGYPPSHCRG